MATSEERREVAKALRGDPNDTLIPQVRDGFEGMTYHEAAYRFWHMCRRIRSAADIDIAHSTTSWLAKLIDPTCHDTLPDDYGAFECSECGTQWSVCPVYIGQDGTSEHDEEKPRFCPNCGARVVSE